MKKLVCMILILTIHTAKAQAPDPDFNDKVSFNETWAHRKSASFTESTGYASYDLIYQRLNFTVDPAVCKIAGSVFSTLKISQENVDRIQFDLVDVLIVDSIKLNLKKVTFQHSSDKITISLVPAPQKNSLCTFEIFYHGIPPEDGMGSFALSKHNNSPILWTLSEPYGAKDWWPCKQSLIDKIDSLDIFITCPSQYKSASNGILVSDQVNSGKRTSHWKHRYPIATYLVAIAVSNYETYSDFLDLPGGKKIEVLNYIYPEYLTTAKSKSAEVLSIMAFFNSKLITYPFAAEKYGHAQFDWGGGMEHQTMSFMVNLDFELVAHEMAHQWFGDYITLSSWHDIWLNEGFATYLSGLAYENLLNGTFWPAWKEYQVNRITSFPDGSVYVADTTDVFRLFNGRLSYSKGAYLLHMLRWEMGDDKFFKGLKSYVSDPTIANGFATQKKFVKHIETAADTTFTEFFKDWYYGEGYPIYKLVKFSDPANPGKQKLRISQRSLSSSVGFFEMHIPIRIWKNGKYKDLRLHNTQQNQEFDISNETIDKLEFDPDKWLCAKIEVNVSSPQPTDAEQIQIIPDYAGNRVRILLPSFTENEMLRIIDLNGRIIRNSPLSQKDSWIDILPFKEGFYVFDVQARNHKETKKILIQK